MRTVLSPAAERSLGLSDRWQAATEHTYKVAAAAVTQNFTLQRCMHSMGIPCHIAGIQYGTLADAAGRRRGCHQLIPSTTNSGRNKTSFRALRLCITHCSPKHHVKGCL